MSHSILVSVLAFSILTACASQPEKSEVQALPTSNVTTTQPESTLAYNEETNTVSEATASAFDSVTDKTVKKKKAPKKKKKPTKRKQRV